MSSKTRPPRAKLIMLSYCFCPALTNGVTDAEAVGEMLEVETLEAEGKLGICVVELGEDGAKADSVVPATVLVVMVTELANKAEELVGTKEELAETEELAGIEE